MTASSEIVRRRFRVGLVVFVALVSSGIGIFMVGQRANLFTRKVDYRIHFQSAAGLTNGNAVRLAGVTVGNVTEVALSEKPGDSTVSVIVSIERRMSSRIRTDTTASIKTIGLLGDKYVDLDGGSAEQPEVPIGGEIPAAPGAGLEKLLEGSGDLLTDLSAIARSLKNILGRTEEGKGFLGALTTESREGKELEAGLQSTLRSLNAVLRKVESGQGLVGRLLIDEKYGKQTADSLAAAIRSVQTVFGKVDEEIRSGNGAIPALLSDPEGKKRVFQLLDNLSAASVSLAKVTSQLEKGDGALPILLHDERFGREFTNNLREFSHRLNSIGRKLDEGTGTAGKLINDPAIFDAANDLVIGVNESKLLRWLVRDRQKSGIRKRYELENPAGVEEAVPDSAPPPPTPTPRHASSPSSHSSPSPVPGSAR
jgi:phospholipid/cholesterol/gamma-HCH transport system substrate-binding protein